MYLRFIVKYTLFQGLGCREDDIILLSILRYLTEN